MILVAHEMDYKKHPHFTIIRRLVEENELPYQLVFAYARIRDNNYELVS